MTNWSVVKRFDWWDIFFTAYFSALVGMGILALLVHLGAVWIG
jgi:hypothetical protein